MSPLPTIGHLIGGQLTQGGSRSAEVFNPATGKAEKTLLLADKLTVEQAIANAQAAFPEWRNTPPLKRARVMSKLKVLLEEHADALCALVTAEHGKVLPDAMGELQRGIENVEYASYAPELLKGEHSKNVGPSIDSWSEFQALGVTAGITPFNFPIMVPLWMWPMAVVCGNTFVLKPSERDPSSTLLVAQLALQAGLPPGVLNVVNGDKEAVDTLLTDPRVKAISFVGSTPIAEYIYATGCAHGKRVQALGGAKNHAVIMPDADLDAACEAVTGAAFGSAGERCMAISVVVAVGDAAADGLIARLEKRIAQLKVGAPEAPGVDMGPLVTEAAQKRVQGYIDAGVAAGATLCADGRGVQVAERPDGYYVGPTLFDRVTADMSVYRDEIFGPVLSVVRVADYAAAMDLVNSHEFANGTVIFTQSGAVAKAFVRDVEVGMVGVNVPIPVPMAFHSFGGWRSSLFGDHHMHGPEGVRFYTRLKTVTERWPEPKSVSADFVMPTMK